MYISIHADTNGDCSTPPCPSCSPSVSPHHSPSHSPSVPPHHSPSHSPSVPPHHSLSCSPSVPLNGSPWHFPIGTKVLKKDFLRKRQKGSGLDCQWLGPFEVIASLEKGLFRLKQVDGNKVQYIIILYNCSA